MPQSFESISLPRKSLITSGFFSLLCLFTSCDGHKSNTTTEQQYTPTISNKPAEVSEFPTSFKSIDHFAVVNCNLNRPKGCDLSKANTISFITNEDGSTTIKEGSGPRNLNSVVWMTSSLNKLRLTCNSSKEQYRIDSSCVTDFRIDYPNEDTNRKDSSAINAKVSIGNFDREYKFPDPEKD
jgi:hypothetical protein